MYAIVKTGGKQYRVEEGQSLLVERLPDGDGAKVGLEPLLYVDGSTVVDGKDLGRVKVEAKVVAHERGPKLRVVKFKPKRGYRRRTGHRQELTRLEVTAVKLAARRASTKAEPKPVAAETASPEPAAGEAASAEAAPKPARKPAAREAPAAKADAPAKKPAPRKAPARKPPARKPPAQKPRTPKTEEGNGA
jgi:large subunit ribosomal protein L21